MQLFLTPILQLQAIMTTSGRTYCNLVNKGTVLILLNMSDKTRQTRSLWHKWDNWILIFSGKYSQVYQSQCSTTHYPGIILCMHPANERWCYIVTSSLIGWVHAQKDPCYKETSHTWAEGTKIWGCLFIPSLVQIIACHPLSAKPLSHPMIFMMKPFPYDWPLVQKTHHLTVVSPDKRPVNVMHTLVIFFVVSWTSCWSNSHFASV